MTAVNTSTGKATAIGIDAAYASITPDGTKAYLSTMGSVTIIDASTHQQINNIPLQGNNTTYPSKVVFANGFAYVATGATTSPTMTGINSPVINRSSRLVNLRRGIPDEGNLSVIDMSSGTVTDVIPISGSSNAPPVLSVSPDGSKVYCIYWMPSICM